MLDWIEKYERISRRLLERENWSDELVYVHVTRALIFAFLGIILGFLIGISL